MAWTEAAKTVDAGLIRRRIPPWRPSREEQSGSPTRTQGQGVRAANSDCVKAGTRGYNNSILLGGGKAGDMRNIYFREALCEKT
jgi:hypothetical protein